MMIYGSSNAAVSFSSGWQYVKVYLYADEVETQQDEDENNGGGDSDLDVWIEVDDPCSVAYAQGQLETFYEPEKLTVDGRLSLRASLPLESPYMEVSARTHIYYLATITITDEPAWLKITGYLTPDKNHSANDHFFVGAPEWYWNVSGSGDKAWTIETALFDVGDHSFYGGVDYTLVAMTEDSEELYADYFFSVEEIPPPVFEPSDADFDGSGRVNLVDLSLFASAWLWEEGT